MRLTSLFAISMLFGSVLAACSGDDGGGGGNIDAPKVIDAPIDAAPVAGLGKACVPAMMGTDCPTNASTCAGFTGAGGTYCTPLCVTMGTAVGGANGQFASVTPMPSDTICAGAFTGTVGMPQCVGVLNNYMPTGAITMGTNYTNVNMTCAILCGASMACPTGLTANNSLGACICVP
jgi:hypothetical protein